MSDEVASNVNEIELDKLMRFDQLLKGEKLYGDDFSLEEIEAWFKDEEEGYFNLGAGNKEQYIYGYHALNLEYGFRFLPDKPFSSVLGFGSAYGHELLPILERSSHITIMDSSGGFATQELKGVRVNYVKPEVNGILPFSRDTFDLVTCFSVLHHIPNVTTVINEIYRCLQPGGYALVREPTISMGDWRVPRKGLTKRERGIPDTIFNQIILASGLEIKNEHKCMFSLTSRLHYFLRKPVYNSRLAVKLDKCLCSLPFWSNQYHPNHFLHKLRPTAVFYVLFKSN